MILYRSIIDWPTAKRKTKDYITIAARFLILKIISIQIKKNEHTRQETYRYIAMHRLEIYKLEHDYLSTASTIRI